MVESAPGPDEGLRAWTPAPLLLCGERTRSAPGDDGVEGVERLAEGVGGRP